MIEVYSCLYDHELETWAFQFHAVCWDILLDRLSISERLGVDRTATILHWLLYCTTWNRHGFLRPGNDLGGTIEFQDDERDIDERMADEGFCHLAADPSRVDLHEILRRWSLSSFEYGLPSAELAPGNSRAQDDVFLKLPTEVIHILLSWLPIEDLLRIRLASRPIANVSRPDVLPQSFWRSRFAPPFEMGYYGLFIHTERHQDWTYLYFALRGAVDPWSLKNRKRIWDIASANASLFRSHLHSVELAGETIAPIRYREPEDTTPAGLQLGNVVATQMTDIETVPLPVGSRQLFDRGLSLNLNGFTITSITISTITFHGQLFISGLRFLAKDPIGACKCHDLGYLTAESSTTLQIPPGQTLKGLEIAAPVNGIVAVRCIFEVEHCEYSSNWIGDVGEEGSDVAFGKLLARPGSKHIGFFASFDAFKMIALALTDDVYSDSSRVANSDASYVLMPQQLWTPTYPEKKTFVPEPQRLNHQKFQPNVNMDFGADGNLQRLTRIVAHMEQVRAPIVGFTFHYIDKQSLLYGRKGGTEVSFLIRGPEGERISSVTYDQTIPTFGILSLQLRTNFGNWITFTFNERIPDRPGNPPPDAPLLQGQPGHMWEVQHNIRTLEPPKGQMITGFTTILEASSGAFQTFGLQCEDISDLNEIALGTGSPKGLAFDVSPTAAMSILGSESIDERGVNCKAYTCASPSNVKRIGFSSGSVGSTRCENEISGLWVDHFAPQPPGIVGQWLSETDAFTLSEDERVVEVIIWTSDLEMSTAAHCPVGRAQNIYDDFSRSVHDRSK